MYKNRKAKRGFALAIACLALCFAVVCGLAACTSSSSSSAASASASASSAAASASASSASAAASGTISFTDSAGRTVEVPANIERVAISGPISQMFMLTLCPEKLVGLSNALSDDEIKYVAGDIANLPVFGQIYGGKGDFNKEAVANANPQIVIDIGEAKKTIVEDLDAIQQSIGIPCIHVEASIDSYDEAYKMLGKLLGVEDRANTLADYCTKAYADTTAVVDAIPEADRVKVLYLLGNEGLNVMGKGSFQGTVVDKCADNLAVLEKVGGSGLGNESSFEQIALWNPPMIIFAPGSVYGTVGSDATWQSIDAIANNNYYEVPGVPYNWISSPPGINQVLGYQWFAHLCYPDKFSDSVADVAKGYYKTFYQYDLTDAEVAAITANSAPKN